MSHYGTTPATVAASILTGLAVLKMHNGGYGVPGGSGCVRTVARIESEDPEDIERGLTDGLPGVLVVFQQGTFEESDTGKQVFDELLQFRILVAVGATRDAVERMTGGEVNHAVAKFPGIEDMQDWAIYFGCRAARQTGIRMVKPVRRLQNKTIGLPKGTYVCMGAVDIQMQRQIDIYDDATGHTLLKLGIVHSPSDYAHLFNVDNVTPKSSFPPPGVDGGVNTL
jgi:hypothetical protein